MSLVEFFVDSSAELKAWPNWARLIISELLEIALKLIAGNLGERFFVLQCRNDTDWNAIRRLHVLWSTLVRIVNDVRTFEAFIEEFVIMVSPFLKRDDSSGQTISGSIFPAVLSDFPIP
ncbi:hypothetical protein DZD18_10905 [Rhodobacteraceae bacterium W635]|nr:hypothetical protein DZD18_10905 [Rhodobacteraceae bacterium W635]